MQVNLIDYARDPLEKLYGAYRTCYSPRTPAEVWDELRSGKVDREQVRAFVAERMKSGHTSPLEQVVFWFGVSGVSRALSHQLVRHRVGISFEQQSQRYVRFSPDRLDYVVPESVRQAGMEEEFRSLMGEAARGYRRMLDAGVPAEDARFLLPNAATTNFQIMVNLAELLHIADLRLCVRAQWEIRRMVAKMRAEVARVLPEVAAHIQPKCGERRMGYCDEEERHWAACPVGKVRPHKSEVQRLIQLAKTGGGSVRALNDADLRAAEEFREAGSR